MNLYQAGYFRHGKQGSNAGWGIVSPSNGMSKIAKDGFRGIAANLIELKSKATMPVVNLGVFLYDRFVYLMHVNYAACGEDARGVTFVHGYCFNITDFYEFCIRPEMLLGVTEDNFRMDYDELEESYPVKNELSYLPFSWENLFEKYCFTDEEYKRLIFGAINALEGYSSPLCIKAEVPAKQYLQMTKELLYLIMMGLPYHLRLKLSFFSYFGSNAAVYVSNHIEGNNYVDLDNRIFVTEDTRLSEYEFTGIYDWVKAKDAGEKDRYFKAIADFMNRAFKNPLRETGCRQVEAGYWAMTPKIDSAAMKPQTAVELLQNFLKCELTEEDEVFSYLAALLGVINSDPLVVLNETERNRLMNFYDKTENPSFQIEVCRLLAQNIMGKNKNLGFEELNRMSGSSASRYAAVCDEIQKREPEYFNEYYCSSYLPFALNDVEKIKKYLEEREGKIPLSEYDVLASILSGLAEQEIGKSSNFEQLYESYDNLCDILKKIPSGKNREVNALQEKMRFLIWEQFPVRDFSADDFDKYQELEANQLAEEGYQGNHCKGAYRVSTLMALFTENDKRVFCENLIRVLFTDEILTEQDDKEKIRNLLSERATEMSDAKTPEEFDYLLVMHYDFSKQTFHTLPWGRELSGSCKEAFDPSYISKMLKRSLLLKDQKRRRSFADALTVDLKKAKKEESTRYPKTVLKGLKRYSDAISGKKMKDDAKLAKAQDYAYGLHRLFVGAFMLLTIMLVFRTIWNYEIVPRLHIMLAGFLFALFMMAVFGLKIYKDGFWGIMEFAGLTGILKTILYGVLALALAAGIVVITVAGGWSVFFIGILAYSILAAASTIVYNITAEE